MKESDIERCRGCGQWVLGEPLCDECATVYAELIA